MSLPIDLSQGEEIEKSGFGALRSDIEYATVSPTKIYLTTHRVMLLPREGQEGLEAHAFVLDHIEEVEAYAEGVILHMLDGTEAAIQLWEPAEEWAAAIRTARVQAPPHLPRLYSEPGVNPEELEQDDNTLDEEDQSGVVTGLGVLAGIVIAVLIVVVLALVLGAAR